VRDHNYQVEGILRDGRPIRPARVSSVVLQILSHQSEAIGTHFRAMQNLEGFGRVTVIFDDNVAEVPGSDLSIGGIRDELSAITDFCQYDNQLAAHGYVAEMNDAVDCALMPERYPQSGATVDMGDLVAARESMKA
jgi:hypothetical protein